MMRDTKLIIKISKEDFERCKKRFQMRIDIMSDAIANGIPLPIEHGKLGDLDPLDRSLEDTQVNLEDEFSKAFDHRLTWASEY